MLAKVDVNARRKEVVAITKESQTLDIIRKMKKEKAQKIWRSYKCYRLKQGIIKSRAAKKVTFFLNQDRFKELGENS